jgi:hypothetical protein
MKIPSVLALLFVASSALAASPKVLFVDRDGVKWFEVGTEAPFDGWESAGEYCEAHSMVAPSGKQVGRARAELARLHRQARLSDACYWTSDHTSLDSGFRGYLYFFDRFDSVAQLSEWEEYPKSPCSVRCVSEAGQ